MSKELPGVREAILMALRKFDDCQNEKQITTKDESYAYFLGRTIYYKNAPPVYGHQVSRTQWGPSPDIALCTRCLQFLLRANISISYKASSNHSI